jgi:Nucleolar pre-ribosomal-associated protein 1
MDEKCSELVAAGAPGMTTGPLVYSPGFLLPLVLAGLDSSYPTQSTQSWDESLHLAHRLCEKGCLALTLGSLCSTDGAIRRLAVSVLGAFVLIIESEPARHYSLWRERPQVSLLLRSVQKAFCIRFGDVKLESLDVPKFPGLSALFLARASLILSRPDDDMYSAMNRYFLQSTTENGAFQDIFRVPCFIALFNSASEEPGLARIQRLWALRLVRDGFLDGDCLKPLLSCHALPLFLTSFDSFRIRSESDLKRYDEEAILLLSILCKVLESGGAKAQEILTGRLGLLHWLHSVLVGRPILDLLPDDESRLLFLKLVCLAIDGAESHDGRSELSDWCNRTAQAIVDMTLASLNAQDNESCRQAEKLSIGAAGLLKRISGFVSDVEKQASSKHAVLHFKAVIELLKRAPESTRSELLVSLCRIPTTGNADPKDVDFLVVQILSVLESTEDAGTDLQLLELALEHVEQSAHPLPKDLATRFASLRRRFNRQSSTQHRYKRLVEAL